MEASKMRTLHLPKSNLSDIDTVIFDLDGTLLYTIEDLHAAVNFALEKYGYPTRSVEEVTAFIGNGVKVLMRRSAPNEVSDEICAEMLDCFRAYYLEHMFDHTRPYPQIKELVTALKGAGYKMAIVSNKLDPATKKMNELFFYPDIPVAIGAPSNHKKPDPYSVFTALEELGSVKEHTIYVGDTDVDKETADNAGLLFVGCAWGYRDYDFLKKLGAKIVLKEPAELLTRLLLAK